MIRQVNKQTKDSHRRGHLDHHNPYSASSSSISTINSEPAMGEMSAAHRPSALVAEKPTSRGRDEYAASFSRSLLDRRRLSKRDQSISQSPAASLYSVDSAEQGLQGAKESFVPHLFSRRKPSRDDGAHRRFQISNPFNFKHVIHSDREASSNNQPPKPSNLLAMKATGPSSRRGQRHVAETSISHRHVFVRSSDRDSDAYERQPASAPILISPPIPALAGSVPVTSGTDHLMRRIRSSEELRTPSKISFPPPPESSAPEGPESSASGSPDPPPRTSSRQAAHLDAEEQMAATPLVRPRTSGSFRQSRQFNLSDSTTPLPAAFPSSSPPASPKRHGIDFHGMVPALAQDTWPIAGAASVYETGLADVPEEEEHRDGFKRSRMSMASIASLRGSHSVPMLRRLSRAQRTLSGASETLGRFDFRALPASTGEESEDGQGFHCDGMDESWEDDIDYCYEHEAEADCDYQWERRSMDIARTAQILEGLLIPECPPMPVGTSRSSSGMLSVPEFEVLPLQINTSQAASTDAGEPPFYSPLPGNFSFPRVGGRVRVRASHASSFKESQGFTLSPSLLIPDEFHHQLLLETGFRGSFGEEEDEYAAAEPMPTSHFDESPTTFSSKLAQWFHQRSSTSTTASGSTSRSDLSREGHNSATSSWSFLTRPTTSGTCGSRTTIEATEQAPSPPSPPSHHAASKTSHAEEAQQDDLFSDEQDTVPELVSYPRPKSSRTPHHKAHASESVIRNETATTTSRHHRTRTTSVSTQLPPVGQYSLFPRSAIRPMGDQI